MVAGHSYGEYVALYAAGVFDFETLCRLSMARGKSIIEAASADLGTMAAADASPSDVGAAVESLADVWLSNFNSPRQTILSGSKEGIEAAIERLSAAGIRARALPVACAFHSPIVAPARKKLAEFLDGVDFQVPRKPVYSNVTAGRYPERSESIRKILADHLEKPVLFADQVRAMYDAGARLFVEVGPRNVLTGLSGQILEGLPHVAVALDVAGRSGLTQLQHGLGILAAEGVPVNLQRLFTGRMESTGEGRNAERQASPTTWIVNGSRARRPSEPRDRAAMPPVSVSFGESAAAAPDLTPASPGTPMKAMPAAAPAVSSRGASDSSSQAMLEFQNVMNRFLETQRSVMSAYLRGSAGQVVSDVEPRASETPLAESLPAPESLEPAVEIPTAMAPPSVEVVEPEAPAGRDKLEAQLLEIVSERTGYPPDMLGLDVDIEAELGIDSIKRVEILGTVQRTCLPEGSLREDAMEQLNGIKTLRGIVDWLETAVGGARSSSVPTEPPRPPSPVAAEATTDESSGSANEVDKANKANEANEADEESSRLSRATLQLVDRPLAAGRPARWRADSGTLLVTEDARGVARELVTRIREGGGRAVLLRPRTSPQSAVGADFEIDLTDPVAVEALLKTVRDRGDTLCGLVHLAPWSAGGSPHPEDIAGWRQRLAVEIKGFFYIARSIARDLERQVAAGGSAWCVASMPTGGGESPRLLFAGHAALRGMAKTLALEWSGAHCASVEIESSEPPQSVARRIFDEISSADGVVEVVYQGGRRMARLPKLAPLALGQKPALALGSDSVILLVGGARGITAEVAVDLAKRYRSTFLLWGRVPEPAREESQATRSLSSPKQLKAALIAEAESRGEAATLPVIESRYQQLLKEREVRRTLERIEGAGGRAIYRAVDIRSDGDVAAALSECPRIDVVVHGAGIIEDKLVAQKSPESFDRVFDTKVDGGFVLAKRLARAGVKAFAFFASAAGTFGNRGQFDYAGANEVLGELAEHLNREWPGRVFSMSWGPWEKTGMVSAELRREFEKRGVQLIPVAEGCRLFDAELRGGGADDAVVVIGGGAWSPSRDADPPPTQSVAVASARTWLPLVRDAVLSNGGNVIRARRWLDPSKDLYLTDHRIDGAEVLPMAVASELMAEVVQNGWPELQVTGVRELQLLQGVVLAGGPLEISVVARPQVEASYDRPGGVPGVDVHVELKDAEGGGKPHYRAIVELSDRLPEAPVFDAGNLGTLPRFEGGVEKAYRRWLFHGPLLQGITHIEGLGAPGVAATLQPSPPGRCLKGVTSGDWLIDPVVFDSGLQLFLLWARANVDKTPLPSRFTRLRRYAPIGKEPVRCYLRVLEKSRDPVFYIDVHFVGADGRLLWSLEEMEGVCTRALNRLGGSWLVQDRGLEVAGKSTGPV
jgi:malonyl CoA-acyl carrier protein transacylase